MLSLAACDLTGITDGEALDYDATKIEENVEEFLAEDGFLVELTVAYRDAEVEEQTQSVIYAEKGEVVYLSAMGEEIIMDYSDETKATVYLKLDDGTWVKSSTVYDETTTREDVEAVYGEYVSGIFDYFGMYSDFTGMLMAKEPCTVAGRDCDKFLVSIGLLELKVEYSFCIDKQTGMCLEWQFSAAAGEEADAGVTFSCERFETPYSIELPADAIEGDIDLDEEVVPEE